MKRTDSSIRKVDSERRARDVLVGAIYLDVTSGLTVRVLDSRPDERHARVCLVEATDGSRPGEQWLYPLRKLIGPTVSSASPAPDHLLAAAKDLFHCAERLLALGHGSPGEGAIAIARRVKAVGDGILGRAAGELGRSSPTGGRP
jgi:hypothetical protein